MAREVRRVPAYWSHPVNSVTGRYQPLLKREDYEEGENILDYMPEWKEEDKTHFMMYEACSDGTPISPAFNTKEELALWLYDNKVSLFGHLTASYLEWLAICNEE